MNLKKVYFQKENLRNVRLNHISSMNLEITESKALREQQRNQNWKSKAHRKMMSQTS